MKERIKSLCKENKKSQSKRRYLQQIHIKGRDPLQCKLKKTGKFVENEEKTQLGTSEKKKS